MKSLSKELTRNLRIVSCCSVLFTTAGAVPMLAQTARSGSELDAKDVKSSQTDRQGDKDGDGRKARTNAQGKDKGNREPGGAAGGSSDVNYLSGSMGAEGTGGTALGQDKPGAGAARETTDGEGVDTADRNAAGAPASTTSGSGGGQAKRKSSGTGGDAEKRTDDKRQKPNSGGSD